MKCSQIEFGRERIEEVARKWGVTVEQAANILLSNEHRHFFEWVNAMEFLEEGLYTPWTSLLHKPNTP